MQRFILFILATLLIGSVVIIPPAFAANLTSGTEIFQAHCAGCHLNGGNIVRRGKTLKLKALERNGINNLEAIAALIAQGKNNMPAYSDRLSSTQIQTVSDYVLSQAEQGWN